MNQPREQLLTVVLGDDGLSYWQRVKDLFGANLVAFWPMWDAAGLVATDISGNNLHGAYEGTTVLNQPGLHGKKSISSPAGTAGMRAYSNGLRDNFPYAKGYCEAWVKMANAEAWTNPDTYTFVQFQADTNNRLLLRKIVGTGLQALYIAGGVTTQSTIANPASTRWLKMGISWDKPNDKLCLFANGLALNEPTTGLGVFAGTLAAGNSNFGSHPGHLQFSLVASLIPTDAQIYNLCGNRAQVVYEGDSRTAGKPWTHLAADQAYPAGGIAYGGRAVASRAVTGSGTQGMINRAAAADALLNGARSTLVVWCGVNDNGSKTAQQIYDSLKSYCEARRAAGWSKILLCTEIDASPAGWNAKYQALNALIAADHSFADGLADLGARPELQNFSDVTYFVDGVHLTAAGYQVVADVVAPALAALG
jgi:lysophospholipase L1-like esterase